MALFEFQCAKCKKRFEIICKNDATTSISCPHCQSGEVSKLISKFAVKGQGDQRESTMHGCHSASPEPAPSPKRHKHGSGCGHCH